MGIGVQSHIHIQDITARHTRRRVYDDGVAYLWVYAFWVQRFLHPQRTSVGVVDESSFNAISINATHLKA
jgi:hypothetical protein